MNVIDITILVILGFFCLKGFFRGIIMEVFTLLGLLAAYVIALREMNIVAVWINRLVSLPSLFTSTVSFFLIFLVISLLCHWLAGLIRHVTRWSFLGWIDRSGGMVFGLFKGALVASLLALLISLISSSPEMRREENNSFLFRPVRSIAPTVFNFLKKTIPQTKDFYDEIKEGLSNTSKQIVDKVFSKHLESLHKELENRVKK